MVLDQPAPRFQKHSACLKRLRGDGVLHQGSAPEIPRPGIFLATLACSREGWGSPLDSCQVGSGIIAAWFVPGLADKVQFSALLWPSCAKSGMLYLHGGQRETGIPVHEPGQTRERLKEVRATHARAKKSGPLTPPFPNRPHWRAARPPLVDAQATTPGGAPKERTRGRAATGRAEQAELVLKSPGEKEHGAQRSVPRLWKRSFCSSGPDKNGTVSCRIHRCWSSTPSCVRCERLAGMAVCAL